MDWGRLGQPALGMEFAKQFASDLFNGLDSSWRNLGPSERTEAWVNAANVITGDSSSDRRYLRCCIAVAAKLPKLGNEPRSC